MRLHKNKNKGFTLIELLVVIAIIGLLSSVVLISLSNARTKARDAKRREDIKSLASALELYYNDNNGYPSTSGAWWGNCATYGSHGTTGATGWIPNLSPTYVAVLPLDPKPTLPSYCYLYNSNGTDYMVLVYNTVENCTGIANDPMRRQSYPAECDYSVYSSGARAW